MKVFGTDGLRDAIGGPLLDPSFVYRFARAVARWALKRTPNRQARIHAILGRDTRYSGESILLQLAQGLEREGVGIFDAEICPTPAIAMAVRDLNLDLGIAVTASHNPASDNGIKLFGPGGEKLTHANEEEIEAELGQILTEPNPGISPTVRRYEGRRHYLKGYAELLPKKSLMAMRVVVDASNGATFQTTAEILTTYGASVESIHHTPDGYNINAGCGSEHPEALQNAVRAHSADLGIAHDGDGDRILLCDSSGQLLSGDALLAILAIHSARRGNLPHMGIVSTIMSNYALDATLQQEGIQLVRTGVGDREVFFKMKELGWMIGGESSGHIIALEHLPTGDGLLAGLLLLRTLLESGKSLAEWASIYSPYPQRILNLAVSSKPDLHAISGLRRDLEALEKQLGEDGRLLLRYSGTEAKIRLLVEARRTV